MALLDDDLTEVASCDIGSRDEHCGESEEGLSESEYRECESINRAKGYDTRVVKDRTQGLSRLRTPQSRKGIWSTCLLGRCSISSSSASALC